MTVALENGQLPTTRQEPKLCNNQMGCYIIIL